MSDTRNLQDGIELMKLQAKHFQLAGISHLGIEDEYYQSPLFREFVATNERYVKSTLSLPENVKLDLEVFRPESRSSDSKLMDISSQVREIKDRAKGVLIKIFLPEIKSAENDTFTSSYKNPKTAFVYGETYEDAIYKAGEFADCYVQLSLSCDRLMYENGDLLAAELQPATIGREMLKAIRNLFPV